MSKDKNKKQNYLKIKFSFSFVPRNRELTQNEVKTNSSKGNAKRKVQIPTI